jgi:hypothetical protein
MIAIKPTFWRPGNVVAAVLIGGFCLIPALFLLSSPAAAIGPSCLAIMALMVWLLMRPIRLEITETEVRAKHGWSQGVTGKNEAVRSEIRSIHYRPTQVTFRGADGQPLMEASHIWTLGDMVRAAAELRVPLYDDRVEGLLRARELPEGRLTYDPASGPVTPMSGKRR